MSKGENPVISRYTLTQRGQEVGVSHVCC